MAQTKQKNQTSNCCSCLVGGMDQLLLICSVLQFYIRIQLRLKVALVNRISVCQVVL